VTPQVVVVGPPGAGKSTVATLLGEWLRLPVRDTDADVEQVAGCSVADIFVERGEPAFRTLERAAVANALAEHDGVLSLGGGAVLDPDTERDLAGHTVVFLDVGIADAARRIGFNRDRPLLIGNPRGRWLALMAERRPVYERVATCVVSTDGRTAQEVASAVIAALDHLEVRP
jgi:shikimate kinase